MSLKYKIVDAVFSENTRFPKVNRDFSGIYSGRYGKLYIVSRGIGKEGAEIISQLAVVSIKNFFDKMPEKYNTMVALRLAFVLATKEVLSYISQHNWLSGCSASVGLLLMNTSGTFIAHAGDCRVLLLRKNKLSCLTKDHFSMKEISDIVNSTESLMVPIISNTVGLSNVEPEIIPDVRLYRDDGVLIMTKGVYQRVTRGEMTTALSIRNITDALKTLWQFAKDKKSADDFTLIAIRVLKAPSVPLSPELLKRENTHFYLIVLFFLTSLAILFYTLKPWLYTWFLLYFG
jgi:serine/threonine protein phosphatase PrpC